MREKTKVLVNVEEYAKESKGTLPHAVAEIDVEITLSNMYQSHIDYKIAKTNLKHAIEESKYAETRKKEIRIKI